ncbi:MAG TPA: ABC transporter ATP-binding protein [Roseiflexaceae bacterium]|nr:ABC transporter ATP-binding protein [Roseiflexaceae bacterium]HMP42520.1 ABC transporter ATP-binding protein [Roseiflexaceae bacterium]
MTDLVIDTRALRKVYGRKTAVADLTLQVPRGEVFGFLGPNGAGKSTSVKMLLGLVIPSSGSARVLGAEPGAAAVMARIGFLPEHFRFHEWMRAGELLDLHGRLYGMPSDARRRRISDVLELVGLTEHTRRPLTDFSKGMLQRIGLAQALLNDPELVFLDEPTSALDPFGRILVRSLLHDLKSRGTTVFLNSHLLGEVEATCDRVAFIKEGRVLQTIVLRDLHAGKLRVELRVDAMTPALHSALSALPATELLTAEPESGLLQLMVADEELLPEIAATVLASGARLYALTPQRLTLEQIFLDVIGREDSGQ